MVKFRVYVDKDKEEKFLNNLSKKGYCFKKYFLFFYTFEKCESNEYTFKIDIIRDKNYEQKQEFFSLLNETGIELVQTWGVWAFFKKRGEFEIYSDVKGKIDQYTKIRNLFLLVGFVELIITPSQWNIYLMEHSIVGIVGACFLTFLSLTFFYQAYKSNKKINFYLGKAKNE